MPFSIPDKKIVRLPAASGHHSVRAHHYDNNDNGDDEDAEANTRNSGTALESGKAGLGCMMYFMIHSHACIMVAKI